MSQSGNQYLAERWLLTAEEDLGAAVALTAVGMHAHACFYCQQSGEKAVKSLWYLVDANPWGHSVQRLIDEFPRRVDLPDVDRLIGYGALLDKYYIPTRYPNGLPDLTPGKVYQAEDSQRGLEAARALIAVCRAWLREWAG